MKKLITLCSVNQQITSFKEMEKMTKKHLLFGILVLLTIIPLTKGSILFQENFVDDFNVGRDIPDTIVANKSTAFTYINNHNWDNFLGYICMRDRDWPTPGGGNGGFEPCEPVSLDICGGYGGYITFQFPFSASNLHIEFDVHAYGSDGGHLFKYVSADGDNWLKVGDSNDALGIHAYNLLSGGAGKAYFRLQAGTAAGIYEGIHITNLKIVEGWVSEPAYDGVIPPPLPPAGERAIIPEPATLLLLSLGGLFLRKSRR